VDDLSNMRRLMKNIIKNLGFKTIHEAGDGKEGLAVLE
jgi:CheY-like chemotaxis protein